MLGFRGTVKVNHKRVYRLSSEAKLVVKHRKRRKRVMVPREPLALPTRRNEVWSMDFVMDAPADGHRIKVLDQLAYGNGGVQLKLIRPGNPRQNAFIESFNGKFRDECLNEHWLHTLSHARAVISNGEPIT
jgi:putative transposase